MQRSTDCCILRTDGDTRKYERVLCEFGVYLSSGTTTSETCTTSNA